MRYTILEGSQKETAWNENGFTYWVSVDGKLHSFKDEGDQLQRVLRMMKANGNIIELS